MSHPVAFEAAVVGDRPFSSIHRSRPTRHFGSSHPAITPEWSLALIGNASGQIFGAERGPRSEAFSMRRLGGSRWRLRRTRCAMGFERQRGSEQSLGRAARRGESAVGMVGVVAEMSKSACGKLQERLWGRSGHTGAWACRSTSPGR